MASRACIGMVLKFSRFHLLNVNFCAQCQYGAQSRRCGAGMLASGAPRRNGEAKVKSVGLGW